MPLRHPAYTFPEGESTQAGWIGWIRQSNAVYSRNLQEAELWGSSVESTIAGLQTQITSLNTTFAGVSSVVFASTLHIATCTTALILTQTATTIPGMTVSPALSGNPRMIWVHAVMDMQSDTAATGAVGELRVTPPGGGSSVQPAQVLNLPGSGSARGTFDQQWIFAASTGTWTFEGLGRKLSTGGVGIISTAHSNMTVFVF